MSAYQCQCCRPSRTCARIEFRELGQPGGREAAMARYREELRTRAAERDEAPDDRAVAARMAKLGVPGDAISALDHLDPGPAEDAARRYLRAQWNIVPFLFLAGGVGVGKTVAAALVFADAVRKHPWNNEATGSNENPLVFIRASRLTSLTDWNADHARWLDQLLAARLLVLDDLGDEGTGPAVQRVTDLLLARCDKKRRTVITSNLTAEALKRRYGEALFDRIRTMSIAPNLAGLKSHRKKRDV